MKVLFVNGVCGNGSTGKIVEQLADEVIKNGGESLICFGRKSYLGEIPSYKFCTKTENRINGVMQRLFDNEGLGLKTPTYMLIKIIKEFCPDVIHLHNLHGYYLNYKTLFKFLKNSSIKVVWTLHDCWTFTGHCTHFEFINCYKWKTECNHCPNKKQYPKSIFIDNSKNNFTTKKECFSSLQQNQMTIISPSKWLDNLVGQSFLKKYNHAVINNGIDLKNFYPVDFHSFDDIIDRTKKIVLAVANKWEERKGFNDVIEIGNRLPDNYQVVIVGVNDKQMLKLENSKFVGIKRTENQTQLAELYSLSSVFINTTYEDNFPTVNLEALACGCPVITYKTGGSVEVVKEENGKVVEQGNIEDMLNTILFCSENANYDRNKISELATVEFNRHTMSEHYLECYKQLLNL